MTTIDTVTDNQRAALVAMLDKNLDQPKGMTPGERYASLTVLVDNIITTLEEAT